jgi:alkyl hydroperoxide reductase subunit AhpF
VAEFLAESSQKVTVEIADIVANGNIVRRCAAERIPALVIATKEGAMAHFEGSPTGYLFEALISSLVQAGSLPSIPPDVPAWAAGLERDLHLSVFSSPACPSGPAMIGPIHKLCLAGARIIGRAINVDEFPHLAVKHGIKALPSLVSGEALVAEGPLAPDELLARIKKLVA